MNKNVLIVENIREPIDEGIKKVSFHFAKYCACKNYDIFTHFSNSDVLNTIQLPNNKLLFSKQFVTNLRSRDNRTLIYIPYSSATFLSFIRVYLLKFYSRSKNIILFSIQKRKHNYLQKIIIKLIKPALIVTFSKEDCEYYEKLGIVAHFYPSGVNVEKFIPINFTKKIKLKKKYGFEEKDKIVLHVGHINKKRNIESLKLLISLGYKILVVGSTTTIQDLSLQKELEFIGFKFVTSYLANIEEVYQLSDIYLFPVKNQTSVIEFPLSILEAMSCNISVLTTRFGGLPDFIQESEHFKYYSSDDELLNKINLINLNKKIENRKIIERKFTWDSIFNKMFEEFKIK